jgi:DNA-directed RNA polymerase beta' subunit
MLKFLDVDKFCKKLSPVSSSDYYTRTGDFHREGLFSEQIFGPVGSLDRRKTYSYINLNSKVIHPTALKLLTQLDRKIEKFISTEDTFIVTKDGRLEQSDEGVTGILNFIKLFPKIKFRGETKDRERFIIVLNTSFKAGTLFINKIPVIPPDHRPIFKDEHGNPVVDSLNDYYLTVLRRSFSMRSAGAGPLYDLLNYGMQKAIVDLDEFIKSKIGKKAGLIRSQILGKRTDFSGRAVITPGPQLKVNEIGIPLKLAVSLFEPFIIHTLLYSGRPKDELEKEIKGYLNTDLSVDSVKRVIKAIKSGDVIPKRLYELFWEATEACIKGRIVLAKRDPVLHAESVRAYIPILVDGNTIQLCTLQVGGHGADFDGDTMAVYHPVTDEAQEEAKRKMLRLVSGSSSKALTFSLGKEMYVGLYLMTKDVTPKNSPLSITEDDIIKATNPYVAVKFRNKNTTMGKAIFNYCLPKDYPFIDKQVTSGDVNSIILDIVESYGDEIAIESSSRLEKFGFKFATLTAPSFTFDQIKIPPEIYKLKQKLDKATTEEAIEIVAEMRKIMIKSMKDTGVYDLVESGAGKGWDQPMQILAAKGIIADPKGNILPPIKGSFMDGLTPKEYFEASSGARKGIIDRVLNTADTGYMSRQFVFLLNTVEASPSLNDCGTQRVLQLKLDNDIASRLTGRFIVKGAGIQEFKKEKFSTGDIIHLRSPIYCKSKKICHTCYGKLLARHRTPYVGVLAAQIIGERGTQMIMRTFHTGGAIKIAVREIIQDIVENDPVVTSDKLRGYLKQEKNTLYCLKDCKITIDLSDYVMGDNIEIDEDENKIDVRGLMCQIEFEDLIFNIILDYGLEINYRDIEYIKKEKITLFFKADDPLFEVSLERQELKEQVLYVQRLLAGREIFRDVDHLLMKLLKIYGPLSKMDLVHLEILLSQCLRDRSNPANPARLGKTWDPVMVNIKKNIFNTSFVQGLAFENVGLAIKTGLISEEVPDQSIIERILTGELVPKKEREDYYR